MRILKYLLLFSILLFCGAAILPSNTWAYDSTYRTEKKHFKIINKKLGSKKGGRRFVLVQTADSATLQPSPETPGGYQLVLNEISPYIQFYKAQPSKSFGIIFMTQYVWFCKIGKSAFQKCKRGALGYVSCASCNESTPKAPEVMELLSPKYIKKENKLIYEVTNVDAFKMKEKDMKGVTLVIDLALN